MGPVLPGPHEGHFPGHCRLAYMGKQRNEIGIVSNNISLKLLFNILIYYNTGFFQYLVRSSIRSLLLFVVYTLAQVFL